MCYTILKKNFLCPIQTFSSAAKSHVESLNRALKNGNSIHLPQRNYALKQSCNIYCVFMIPGISEAQVGAVAAVEDREVKSSLCFYGYLQFIKDVITPECLEKSTTMFEPQCFNSANL